MCGDVLIPSQQDAYLFVSRHNDKNAKIINGRFCQLIPIKIQYQGANRQNNGTSDQAYNNGYSEHPFPIFSRFFCINGSDFPQLLTDNNGSSVGKTPTGDSTNVYYHNSDGICSNHIIYQYAQELLRMPELDKTKLQTVKYHLFEVGWLGCNFHKILEQDPRFRKRSILFGISHLICSRSR